MVTLSLRASGMKNRAAQNRCFGRMSFTERCLTLTNGIRSLTAAAQKRQFAGCYLMKKTSTQSASLAGIEASIVRNHARTVLESLYRAEIRPGDQKDTIAFIPKTSKGEN